MGSKEVEMIIYLNIGACFVSDFHAKFSFWVGNQIGQNVQINSCTQVVNIWQENLKYKRLTHTNSVYTKSIMKNFLNEPINSPILFQLFWILQEDQSRIERYRNHHDLVGTMLPFDCLDHLLLLGVMFLY